MLLLPEQLVDVVIEVPDPELAQPGVLDGRHALGDVPNHLTAEEEVNSPSLGGILSADLLTEDLGLADVVTLAGQVGPPLPHLRPVPLLLLLGLPPPGQANRDIVIINIVLAMTAVIADRCSLRRLTWPKPSWPFRCSWPWRGFTLAAWLSLKKLGNLK